jgi:heme exporter protein A
MSADGVRVEGVSKVYGRHRALSGVSLELRPGRLCALLGHNGAGKSTLIGVLSTLVRPSAGRVVTGFGAEPAQVRRQIGVLAHDSFVYGDLDAVENLCFYGQLYDLPDPRRRAAELLDQVGLDPSARRRPVRTYSRGMLQRVALARALVASPKLLLLDEPFTGLDRVGARALADALMRAREDGRLVVVVTHDLEAIDGLCEQVVVLTRGKVVLDESRTGGFSRAELRGRYDGASA